MEKIVVGKTMLPSGLPIQRLFLISQPKTPNVPKLLVANDGTSVYMRHYPHYLAGEDLWGLVGPVEPISPEGDAALGYHRIELKEFLKDA